MHRFACRYAAAAAAGDPKRWLSLPPCIRIKPPPGLALSHLTSPCIAPLPHTKSTFSHLGTATGGVQGGAPDPANGPLRALCPRPSFPCEVPPALHRQNFPTWATKTPQRAGLPLITNKAVLGSSQLDARTWPKAPGYTPAHFTDETLRSLKRMTIYEMFLR